MANPKPQPKRAKRGEELVQRTRAAVLNAFDAVERKGKVISEILAEEFEKNPLKFMELASKLMPKEIKAEITDKRPEDMSNDEITERLTAIAARRAEILADRGRQTKSDSEPDQLH